MKLKYKDVILLTCNVPNKKVLNNIKNILFKKKLVSCINIINKIVSFYYWEKKIKKSVEIKVIFKSFNFLKKKIIKIIEKIHPYKIPEIITFKINKINKKYFNWMLKTINK